MRLIRWFYTVPLRLRSLFRRKQVEQELDEELRYHLERQIEENIAIGMTPEEARYVALRAIGGVDRRKEECRDMRRVRWIEELMQDLRYGLRMLRKSPGFTAVAVLSLALGIGANTAIFSVVDPILLRSLPVKDPEQLVVLNNVDQRGRESHSFPYPMFEQLRARTQVFSGVFATQELGGDGDVDMVGPEPGNQMGEARLLLVSGEYFQVLGVNAVLGRTLTKADDQTPGAHPVAVLSYRFWQRRFAGDVSIIGKVLRLKNQPFSIIGVMTPEFFGEKWGDGPDIWVPLIMLNILGRDLSHIGTPILARLQPGVRAEQAQAALAIFLGQIKSEPGDLSRTKTGWMSKIIVTPGRQGLPGDRMWVSRPFRILMAVVGLMLLIACANVANLLLARAARRAPEVAIRLTIGAGRFRLIRQFLAESVLLAAAGAVLGLLFAWWGCRVILALMSEYDTSITVGIGEILNARVLGFTIAVSLLTTLIFGLAPALIATRQDLNTTLKAPALPRLSRSRLSFSRSLVIAQVALSLLLLTGTGLVVQTLRNLRTRDVGFAAEHVIHGWINPRNSGYKPEQIPDLNRRILERLSSIPGVSSATMEGNWFPGETQACCITVDGHPRSPDDGRQIEAKHVRHGYFQIIGLPLLLGRDFTPHEIVSEPEKYAEVAIINETMARQYFGMANPLGKRFGWDNSDQFEIVGVAKDAIYSNPRDKKRPLIYFPSRDGIGFVVRTAGPAAPLVATIRREIQTEHLTHNIRAATIWMDGVLFEDRLLAKLAAFFSLLALLLVSMGLYGVMSYDVARRTHEIGIRMALGARRRDVVGLVMRETMLLGAIGVIIGLSVALGATRLIESRLYGLTPNDPLTIVLASLLLLTVAALAGYLPARRAARVDPMVALRHE